MTTMISADIGRKIKYTWDIQVFASFHPVNKIYSTGKATV